jgi:hypothetical protein
MVLICIAGCSHNERKELLEIPDKKILTAIYQNNFTFLSSDTSMQTTS